MSEVDPKRARQLRAEMVARVGLRTPTSPRVLEALGRVPRHQFMPHVTLEEAYYDGAHPIGHGQTISQPTVVAMMTEALAIEDGGRVLEIGTGSGYQTAVLAELAAIVYSVERLGALSNAAETLLDELGYENVQFRVGDGYAGWPEHAPYDAIVVTAAPPDVPPALLGQLADGGRLVIPVGARFHQDLILILRRGPDFDRRSLGAVAFVPMLPG